jgi:hypothetical protein
MSESTTTKPAAPEIDLKPFAAVKVVRRAVQRTGGPRKMENPFESIVRASYETAWTDEDGTKHEHGEPRITVPVKADSEEEKAILRALTRAGRHVGVSVEKEFTDQDGDGNKIRKPNRAILFSAVDKRTRNRNGSKPATLFEGSHVHEGYDGMHEHPSDAGHWHEQTDQGSGPMVAVAEGEQGAPVEGGQSDSTSLTGEQEGTPQAPGEESPTVQPDAPQPAEGEQPNW